MKTDSFYCVVKSALCTASVDLANIKSRAEMRENESKKGVCGDACGCRGVGDCWMREQGGNRKGFAK